MSSISRITSEHAAELCPIKSNIGDNTEIVVKFRYAKAEAA